MRAAAAFIILAIFAAAMLSSHQSKPFPLLIEAAYDDRFCDIRPEPPKKPRGRYDWQINAKREGDIA